MKILFIEDDQPTSELISATLSAHRYAVDTIADGSVGLELATQWSYDLILLDVLIPTLNGIEVCRRLRAQGCQTPILMLTTKDADEDVIAGLDAGADDYVAKSCAPSQLLARVRALLRRGGNAASAPVLTWELLCLDPALAQVTYNHEPIALRPKEYSLLELFLRPPQRILSRSNIIDHLWSMEETPVEGSVTNLIKDLRQRLKSSGMVTDMIETVYGLGYRLKAAPIEDRKTLGRKDKETARDQGEIASHPVLAVDWDHGQAREQRGVMAIQQIAERFHVSLEQRFTVLETAERSLQAGNFSLKQRQAAQTEAHKLAGGLGTFGYVKASEVAQAIERLLENESSQKTRLADQLCQLLEELKHELAKPIMSDVSGCNLV
ncbi:two-component system response regulator [Phormidesmis priestleyi ULC007]|uniref:Two-component system response regulator n=1 Tax=Phormidesmis priestleyi ULC007 TaxID=1920490 RepID=A0A2T1DNH4_9CYAN|nr:response regulator [Phormidesmis priestleyi]PSB21974.1 two-component system response regulator [Phormidesmis priestleyi ULC007]PZO55057.1 MAG: two-component system response regulator [Phormidesmis priestleyi]